MKAVGFEVGTPYLQMVVLFMKSIKTGPEQSNGGSSNEMAEEVLFDRVVAS